MIRPDILVDLDGTLVEPKYPSFGAVRQGVLQKLLCYQKIGHRIIIFTSRPESHKPIIWKFCYDEGFEPDRIICDKPLGIFVDDLSVDPDKVDIVDGINLKVNRLIAQWNSKIRFPKEWGSWTRKV